MRATDTKKLKLLHTFIENAGAEVLATTNEWEVLRFRANGETGVIYKNKREELSFMGQAQDALNAFLDSKHWSAQEKIKRVKKSTTLRTLLKRDGNECFYCGGNMGDGAETVEHILSIKHGGNNHIANMALAHHVCNTMAASMDIISKIKLRDSMRHGVTNGGENDKRP